HSRVSAKTCCTSGSSSTIKIVSPPILHPLPLPTRSPVRIDSYRQVGSNTKRGGHKGLDSTFGAGRQIFSCVRLFRFRKSRSSRGDHQRDGGREVGEGWNDASNYSAAANDSSSPVESFPRQSSRSD